MTPDLDALDALATAATPETEGRWKYRRCDFGHGPDPKYSYVEWGKPDEGNGTAALSPDMAHYIAALDPATVRSLIARVRTGERLLAEAEHALSLWVRDAAASSLDRAWQEAEAALPEGFRLEVHGPIDLSVAARLPQPGVWRARSVAPFMPYEEWQQSVRSEYAASPAAALTALAAALRTPEPVT